MKISAINADCPRISERRTLVTKLNKPNTEKSVNFGQHDTFSREQKPPSDLDIVDRLGCKQAYFGLTIDEEIELLESLIRISTSMDPTPLQRALHDLQMTKQQRQKQ